MPTPKAINENNVRILYRHIKNKIETADSALQSDINTKANINSPNLTGTPTCPTAQDGTNTTQIATTAFVSSAVHNLEQNVASINSVIDTIYPIGAIFMSANQTSPSTLFPGTYWKRLKDQVLMGAGDVYTAGTTGGAASESYTPAGTVGGHTLTTSEMPSHTHTFTGSAVTSGNESQGHTHSVGAHSHGLNGHNHSVPAHSHGLNSHKHTITSHTHSIDHWHYVISTATNTDPLAIQTGSGTVTYSVRKLKADSTYITQVAVSTDANGVVNGVSAMKTDGPTQSSTSGGSGTLTTAGASGNTENSSVLTTGNASGNTANSTAFNTEAASQSHTHSVTAAGTNGSTGGDGSHDHSFTGTASTINTLPPYLAVYMWMRVATANEAV